MTSLEGITTEHHFGEGILLKEEAECPVDGSSL